MEDKKMNVLIVEAEKEPREAEIGDDLKSMQQIVGGTIQAVYPWRDPVALVCNDDGKLIGLPLNCSIEDYDVIAGTFFICGLSEENFASLSPELMEKYKKEFHYVELFFQTGGQIHSVKVQPQKTAQSAKAECPKNKPHPSHDAR
jgi:hypothetical protein